MFGCTPSKLSAAAAGCSLFLLVPAVFAPLFVTRWVADSEVGIARDRQYGAGAYACPGESVLIVDRSGTGNVTSADGLISLSVTYRLDDSLKLTGRYEEIIAQKSSGRDALTCWVEWRAKAAIAKLTSSPSEESMAKFAKEISTELSQYGMSCQVNVKITRQYFPSQ